MDGLDAACERERRLRAARDDASAHAGAARLERGRKTHDAAGIPKITEYCSLEIR